MSDEFTSDAKKQVAAQTLRDIFRRQPDVAAPSDFSLETGSGFVSTWFANAGVLSIQISYDLDLGAGPEDKATELLASNPAPLALMRAMVTCNDKHPAFVHLQFAAACRSPVILQPIMTAACNVARLSVDDDSRDIMFPVDDVQEAMYLGSSDGVAGNRPDCIALALYIVVPLTNSALIARKNAAATFLKSYLHIAAAHRIGPMAATLDAYRLKKG